MPKLRKQRRRQVYRHNVNRKRMRNKVFSVGKIGCKEVKEAWDNKKSIQDNMREMGLAYDPNEAIKVLNTKQEMKKNIIKMKNGYDSEESSEEEMPTKQYVAQKLKENARAPRGKNLRLPNSQIEFLSYLVTKHGTDFKAMARDKKNYYQETWKQIRAKIKMLRSIPEQYKKFLVDNKFTKDLFSEKSFRQDEDSD